MPGSQPARASGGTRGRHRWSREELGAMAADFWKSRHLAWEMLRRSLAREYRESFFGVLLAFLPAIVIAAWATMIRHAQIITIPDQSLPYAPFVLISLMLWQTFTDSIFAPIAGLQMELPTIARSTMPAEGVILAKFGEVVFNFCVRLILIVGAMLWYGIPTTPWAALAPVALLSLIFFGMGLGLILAPLNVFYQDISKGLSAVTTFWLFLTPVIVPVPQSGWASIVVRLNPVTPLLATTRELITLGEVSSPISFGIMAVASVALFVFGCVFFRSSLPVIVDRVNY